MREGQVGRGPGRHGTSREWGRGRGLRLLGLREEGSGGEGAGGSQAAGAGAKGSSHLLSIPLLCPQSWRQEPWERRLGLLGSPVCPPRTCVSSPLVSRQSLTVHRPRSISISSLLPRQQHLDCSSSWFRRELKNQTRKRSDLGLLLNLLSVRVFVFPQRLPGRSEPGLELLGATWRGALPEGKERGKAGTTDADDDDRDA